MGGKRMAIGLAAGALAAAVVGGSAAWAAASNPPASTTYTGCLGSASGSIYNVKQGLSPLAACTGSDKQIIVSGGDITGVTASTGLTGGAAKGAATVGIDPSYQLPQGCSIGTVPASTGSGSWACSTGGGKRFSYQSIAVGGFQDVELGGIDLELSCGATNVNLFTISKASSAGSFNMLYGILGGTVQDAGYGLGSGATRSAAQDVGGTGSYVWVDDDGDVVTGTITWFDPGNGGDCQFAGDMVEAGS
jgi:hypothetical protein